MRRLLVLSVPIPETDAILIGSRLMPLHLATGKTKVLSSPVAAAREAIQRLKKESALTLSDGVIIGIDGGKQCGPVKAELLKAMRSLVRFTRAEILGAMSRHNPETVRRYLVWMKQNQWITLSKSYYEITPLLADADHSPLARH